MFINRKAELEQLNQLYQSNMAVLYVLYGRRRVGKTELLREFCLTKPHIFFIATLSSDSELLASFSNQVYGFIHHQAPQGFTYPSWEAAFAALAGLNMQERPIVIIDEFTYLISGNKAIPSILQKVWDDVLKNTSLMLVLCGSYIGMMENEVLGYRAPLYGRRTASKLLQPLDLPSSALFFPEYSFVEKFLAWAILGGMPYYLNAFDSKQKLFKNVFIQILDNQTGTLFNEPQLLLMEELREPRNYFSILRAVASGRTRLNEISQVSGVGSPTTTHRYLDILQQLHLVTRRTPVTESQPEKSKKGLYQVDDHFLRFWFRYVHPNLSSLELGLAEAILKQRIIPDLDHFVSTAFEEASLAYLARLARNGELGFLPDRIGSWWDRETEIDVVAISYAEKKALVGECKWSTNRVGINVFDDLKRKAAVFMSGSEIEHIEYVLFAKIGFTDALVQRAAEGKVRLYSVDDFLRDD